MVEQRIEHLLSLDYSVYSQIIEEVSSEVINIDKNYKKMLLDKLVGYRDNIETSLQYDENVVKHMMELLENHDHTRQRQISESNRLTTSSSHEMLDSHFLRSRINEEQESIISTIFLSPRSGCFNGDASSIESISFRDPIHIYVKFSQISLIMSRQKYRFFIS